MLAPLIFLKIRESRAYFSANHNCCIESKKVMVKKRNKAISIKYYLKELSEVNKLNLTHRAAMVTLDAQTVPKEIGELITYLLCLLP